MAAAPPPIALLVQTPHLIAVDKPAGVVVVPGRDEDPALSLRSRVEAQLDLPLWVVHRLDRGTTGVCVFARTAEAHRRLCLAFERRLVRKCYRALLAGVLAPDRGIIDLPLHPARKGKMRPAQPGERDGVAARTAYRTDGTFVTSEGPWSLISAWPETGRQHQIRVHVRAEGAPILGDALYGRAALTPTLTDLLRRHGWQPGQHALHAESLRIPGGQGEEDLLVTAPLPPEWVSLLRACDPGWCGRPSEEAGAGE